MAYRFFLDVLKSITQTRPLIFATASTVPAKHRVLKSVDSGVTRTSLQELTEEERVEEIASMLRGDRATARSLDEAREMLSEAESLENA